MVDRVIFVISLIIFVVAFFFNLGLLADPSMASEPIEGAMSIMLLISVVSMFICSSPNWRVLNFRNEPFWSKIFFEYGIAIYYLFVTIAVIYYQFYTVNGSEFFTKTLGLAALLLLFSGLALRWTFNQLTNPLKPHHPHRHHH